MLCCSPYDALLPLESATVPTQFVRRLDASGQSVPAGRTSSTTWIAPGVKGLELSRSGEVGLRRVTPQRSCPDLATLAVTTTRRRCRQPKLCPSRRPAARAADPCERRRRVESARRWLGS